MTTCAMILEAPESSPEVAPTAPVETATPTAASSVQRALGLGFLASYIVVTSFAVGFTHLGPVLDRLLTGI